MPAPNLADADAALAAALQPMRDVMAAIETEISEREAELVALRKRRTDTGRALSALDPQWAAEHGRMKPGPRPKGWKGASGTRISQERLDTTWELLQRNFDGRSFSSQDVAAVVSLHLTTVHKVLKVLHDQGRIQLDHLGGARNTSRFYRLATSEGGSNGH